MIQLIQIVVRYTGISRDIAWWESELSRCSCQDDEACRVTVVVVKSVFEFFIAHCLPPLTCHKNINRSFNHIVLLVHVLLLYCINVQNVI